MKDKDILSRVKKKIKSNISNPKWSERFLNIDVLHLPDISLKHIRTQTLNLNNYHDILILDSQEKVSTLNSPEVS